MNAVDVPVAPATGRVLLRRRQEPPVVTGLGVVAPNGFGAEAYWAATLRGESGIGPITLFDSASYSVRIAGEVKGFVARDHLPGRLLPQTDRATRLALVAAQEALQNSGLDLAALPRYGAGVVGAAAGGGFEFGQKELQALWSQGGEYVSAYQSFAWFYPVNAGQISIRHDLRGSSSSLVAEQAGGLDAVAKARQNIWDGTGAMVSGAVDGALCPWGLVCMIRSGRLSTVPDPHGAYLPFDRRATGYVPGEGGAHLVVEDAAAARARGVDGYGVVAGHGATFDPRPGSGRPPGLRRAIELALDDARVRPEEVDVVLADAVGLPGADRAEAEALVGVFGARGVAVTAPKTMTGRLLAGGASLDVATALLALRDQVVPPTVNVDEPAHDDELDLVRDAPRERPVGTALVVARGHGGFNSALVVRRHARPR